MRTRLARARHPARRERVRLHLAIASAAGAMLQPMHQLVQQHSSRLVGHEPRCEVDGSSGRVGTVERRNVDVGARVAHNAHLRHGLVRAPQVAVSLEPRHSARRREMKGCSRNGRSRAHEERGGPGWGRPRDY